MSKYFTIMFVCTGNTCRSPMAEGALKILLEKEKLTKFRVISSGTSGASGFPATMFAIEAAKIWNADISSHQSQPLTKELIRDSDLIFAMAPSHFNEIKRLVKKSENKTFLFKKFPEKGADGEGVADPIGQSLDKYNETFLEIGEYLGKYIPEIVKRIDDKTND